MRKALITLVVLSAAGFWLWKSGKAEKWLSVAPLKPSPLPAAFPAQETTANTAAVWQSCGMPSLDENWDDKKLVSVGNALRQLQSRQPKYMPDATSADGKAFFGKLRYTTSRFHLLSGQRKIAAYNAFREFLPIYSASRKYDMEVALLIGLQVELIAGVTEDQAFIKNLSDQKTRTTGSLDGGVWILRGEAIGFQGGTRALQADTRKLLKAISDHETFGTEARKLALGHMALHLPTIVRRANMDDIRPLVLAQRNQEPDSDVRAHYDTLLARL